VDHARTSRRFTSFHASRPLPPTNVHVTPRERQIAGAEKRSEPPGVETVCSSPPSLPSDRGPTSTRPSLPSLPPCTAASPLPSHAGDAEPRSRSPDSSSAWFAGVQLPSRRALLDSRRSESPQNVFPSHGPFPVATRSAPVPGSTTAPPRPQ